MWKQWQNAVILGIVLTLARVGTGDSSARAVTKKCMDICSQVASRASVTFAVRGGSWQVTHLGLGWNGEKEGPDFGRIADLSSLESLYVGSWRGRFNSKAFAELRKLKLLRRLVLPQNAKACDLFVACSLSGLEDLQLLDGSGFKDEDLMGLENLESLRRLGIRHSPPIKEVLKSIAGLKRLEELDLSRSVVGEDGVGPLKLLTSLRYLRLSDTKLKPAALKSLAALPGLERLDLSLAILDGDVDLKLLKYLTYLDISNVKLTKKAAMVLPESLRNIRANGNMLEALCAQNALNHIESVTVVRAGLPLRDLGKEKEVDPKRVVTCLKRLPALREVRIEGAAYRWVTELGSLDGLGSLAIPGGCSLFTDRDMNLVVRMSRLEAFEANCCKLTDASMAHIGQLAGLRRVSLKHIQHVTNAGLANLKHLKRLKCLAVGVAPTWKGSLDGVLAAVKGLSDVRDISLTGGLLTDKGLQILGTMKGLEHVDLTGSHGYSEEGLVSLMNALPGLKSLKWTFSRRESQRGNWGQPENTK